MITPVRFVLVDFILEGFCVFTGVIPFCLVFIFALRYQVPEIRDEVPKDFSKGVNFLTAEGSARIGTALSGGLKEFLTFNKCERFLAVHNASFAISDLTTHT